MNLDAIASDVCVMVLSYMTLRDIQTGVLGVSREWEKKGLLAAQHIFFKHPPLLLHVQINAQGTAWSSNNQREKVRGTAQFATFQPVHHQGIGKVCLRPVRVFKACEDEANKDKWTETQNDAPLSIRPLQRTSASISISVYAQMDGFNAHITQSLDEIRLLRAPWLKAVKQKSEGRKRVEHVPSPSHLFPSVQSPLEQPCSPKKLLRRWKYLTSKVSPVVTWEDRIILRNAVQDTILFPLTGQVHHQRISSTNAMRLSTCSISGYEINSTRYYYMLPRSLQRLFLRAVLYEVNNPHCVPICQNLLQTHPYGRYAQIIGWILTFSKTQRIYMWKLLHAWWFNDVHPCHRMLLENEPTLLLAFFKRHLGRETQLLRSIQEWSARMSEIEVLKARHGGTQSVR